MIRSLSALAGALALTCGCMAAEGDVPQVPDLRSSLVRVLVVPRLLSGALSAEDAMLVKAPSSRVRPLEIRWLVDNGAVVASGDLLFQFDNSQLTQNLEQRQVDVTRALTAMVAARSQAGTQIARARFTLRQREADREKARIDADIPEGLKSELEYEKLQLELDRARLEVEAARSALDTEAQKAEAEVGIRSLELEKERADLERAERGIEVLEVLAPRGGVVLLAENRREDRLWQEGDAAHTGDGLARIPDLGSMVVRARLFDVDDGLIAEGQPARVTLDAFPGSVFDGRVRRIEKVAIQGRRGSTTRSFGVLIDLSEVDLERMRPGMSARVEIDTRVEAGPGSAGLLVVPRESLLFRAGEPARVLLESGRWVVVEVGTCGPLRCVVESADLGPDESLGRWVEGGDV